jgi:AcrR family transcriptional regulator
MIEMNAQTMPERINRKQAIVDIATELFLKQGYKGTSIRQIADAVGVTEAAIYYHFKDGKRELLREIFNAELPSLDLVMSSCQPSTSLNDVLHCLGTQLKRTGYERFRRFRWLMMEMPTLADAERQVAIQQHLTFHNQMVALITPFVPANRRDNIAWIILITLYGYGHVFWNMGLQEYAELSVEDFIAELSQLILPGLDDHTV